MDLLIVWISMVFTAVADTRGRDRSVDPVPVFPLNMAPDSVDDDYKGCSARMSELVNKFFLPLEKSGTFEVAWRQAERETQRMNPQSDDLTMNHVIAIRVYSHHRPNIYKPLNNAVRAEKRNYETTFQYHSLHFLLTKAIQLLNPKKTCFTVFRRSDIEFKYDQNWPIRFGSFTSTSLETLRKIQVEFGTKSCFKVKTCYGANVTKYSKHPEEKEVLIPPYEVFKIINVSNKEIGGTCETLYELGSVGKVSCLRCAVFEEPSEVL